MANYRFHAAIFFFSSRRRPTRCLSDWSSGVCSSDLVCGIGGHSAVARSVAPELAAQPANLKGKDGCGDAQQDSGETAQAIQCHRFHDKSGQGMSGLAGVTKGARWELHSRRRSKVIGYARILSSCRLRFLKTLTIQDEVPTQAATPVDPVFGDRAGW